MLSKADRLEQELARAQQVAEAQEARIVAAKNALIKARQEEKEGGG